MTQQTSAAARELAQRRTHGTTGPLLDKALRPQTFAEAFSLQQAVGQIFSGVSATEVAGWKCGLPRADKTVIAALYAATLQHQSDEHIARCQLYANADGFAAVEPELAFELKHDLPPRTTPYSDTEIDAATGTTRLALELIQSRYDDPAQASFFDALADGLVNQGVWLGPELVHNTAHNLAEFLLTIEYPDGRLETHAAKHPDGHPRAGLYWLVNFLCAQGIGLRQGQRIITGSYAGVIKLPMQQTLHLNYGELGKFSIEFTLK